MFLSNFEIENARLKCSDGSKYDRKIRQKNRAHQVKLSETEVNKIDVCKLDFEKKFVRCFDTQLTIETGTKHAYGNFAKMGQLQALMFQ